MKKSKTDEASRVHQPHDKLVKKLLSNQSTARDVLSLYLPAEIQQIVDLNVLELQRDSFIDDEHRAFAVDLLYKTAIQGEESYIWILIEHQRNPDIWMPVRLFRYIALIWDHLRTKSNLKKLPLIYPLVIYNGDEIYPHSLTLSDLLTPESVKPIFSELFTKPFSLIDLASIQDDTLRQQMQTRAKGVTLLMALKHVFSQDLQAFFEQTLAIGLKQLEQSGDSDAVVDVLYYLLKEGKFLEEDHFWSIIHQKFSPNTEGQLMTIAQKLEQRGIEKGIEKEQYIIAERLLAEKVDLAFIKKITELSIDTIKALQKKTN